MTQITYDLSQVTTEMVDILNKIENPTFQNALNCKQWMRNNKVYNILKYDKQILSYDMIEKTGLCRSIIYSNNKINVFAPPKALSYDTFCDTFNVLECYAEEFVEGTMVNLFYDNDVNKWEIATKSSVGGAVSYFKDQPTFEELFYEISRYINLDFDKISKDHMYSFVMQHPKNKFVIPIQDMRLYLIAVYKIEGLQVQEISRTDYYSEGGFSELVSKVWHPYQCTIDSYESLKAQFGSMNTDINCMGIIIKNHLGKRTKIRNPNYEYLKQLRGNNTKIQYHYLCLRKMNRVKEYLKYFPEASNSFSQFRKYLHLFTNNLYSNYIQCYIRKEKPLLEFPVQFRSHMFNLHQQYLTIKEQNGYIHKYSVITYINSLEPARLMYSLNYELRNLGKSLVENDTVMATDTIEY
jgi:hypothetical protein